LTSETYARGGDEEERAGRLIIVAVSILCAVLVIAGLAYATGTGARRQDALAAAQCEPNLSPIGLPCTTVQVLTSQYTATINPAIQQLNTDAAAYTASERRHLAAAEAALTAEVASGRALAAKLASFPFPPAVAPASSALVQAIRASANLTAEQARSSSLLQMRSLNERVAVAGAAVRADLNLTIKALDTPPTVSQEP
jgi:hypothetical protein